MNQYFDNLNAVSKVSNHIKSEEKIKMAKETYKVSNNAPLGLNLRSEPVVKESTKILVMPMGQEVEKLGQSNKANWWEISTSIQGDIFTGFVNSSFLVKSKDFDAPKPSTGIRAVHLASKNDVTRRNKRWAFALNEKNQPTRNSTDSSNNRVKALNSIVKWLDVANKLHDRYEPKSSKTYCNIYAYDYCYLANVYLPRVWWNDKAIKKLSNDNNVSPIYEETVLEKNANSLFNWLKYYGSTFGWKRTSSIDTMQNSANNGRVVIICAQRKNLNRSGHICAVVPETTTQKAKKKNGVYIRPLQSQAGATNRKYQTNLWWINSASKFREVGYWISTS